uniref:Vacuolar ATPase assembly integral membrane protein VMA21 homolog n=1 Tax=Opuntia streptacantha TaxID=393608 RepID=A0A7C8ZKC5_OPUST
MATMAKAIKKFFVASMFMWMFPLAILYGFQHDWFLGVANLSPYSQTLLAGFLAVISVNVVIAFYICIAMKEPTDKHEPDPSFVAKAKASLNQSKPDEKEE